jgi:hypothetical protein
MKTLTIHTLAVALTLWGTSSLAATVEVSSLPVTPADQTDTHKATEGTSAAPFHALNRLDAQTVAEQEMTDQELKAVEGGAGALMDVTVGTGGTTITTTLPNDPAWNAFADGLGKGFLGH